MQNLIIDLELTFFKLERQHKIFIAVAGAAFAVLIVLAYYNPLKSGASTTNNSDVAKARKGQEVYVKYSSQITKLIEGLPNQNSVDVQVSSELQVTNFAGLNGEVRYPQMMITYVQNGKEHNVTETEFKSIQYRFSPDAGNKTKYVYENVKFVAETGNSQLVVSVKPLNSAKVGQQYSVKLIVHNGPIGYALGETMIQIVS